MDTLESRIDTLEYKRVRKTLTATGFETLIRHYIHRWNQHQNYSDLHDIFELSTELLQHDPEHWCSDAFKKVGDKILNDAGAKLIDKGDPLAFAHAKCFVGLNYAKVTQDRRMEKFLLSQVVQFAKHANEIDSQSERAAQSLWMGGEALERLARMQDNVHSELTKTLHAREYYLLAHRPSFQLPLLGLGRTCARLSLLSAAINEKDRERMFFNEALEAFERYGDYDKYDSSLYHHRGTMLGEKFLRYWAGEEAIADPSSLWEGAIKDLEATRIENPFCHGVYGMLATLYYFGGFPIRAHINTGKAILIGDEEEYKQAKQLVEFISKDVDNVNDYIEQIRKKLCEAQSNQNYYEIIDHAYLLADLVSENEGPATEMYVLIGEALLNVLDTELDLEHFAESRNQLSVCNDHPYLRSRMLVKQSSSGENSLKDEYLLGKRLVELYDEYMEPVLANGPIRLMYVGEGKYQGKVLDIMNLPDDIEMPDMYDCVKKAQAQKYADDKPIQTPLAYVKRENKEILIIKKEWEKNTYHSLHQEEAESIYHNLMKFEQGEVENRLRSTVQSLATLHGITYPALEKQQAKYTLGDNSPALQELDYEYVFQKRFVDRMLLSLKVDISNLVNQFLSHRSQQPHQFYLHGDLCPHNVLADGIIIDTEVSRYGNVGDPMYDLAYYLSHPFFVSMDPKLVVEDYTQKLESTLEAQGYMIPNISDLGSSYQFHHTFTSLCLYATYAYQGVTRHDMGRARIATAYLGCIQNQLEQYDCGEHLWNIITRSPITSALIQFTNMEQNLKV